MSPPDESTPQSGSSMARWAIAVAIIIVWLFALVAAYFWGHKPFDLQIVARLGQSCFNLAVWLGLLWLGAGIGRRLAGGTLLDEHPAARLALTSGLGLGLLSLVTLGLGLIGLLKPVIAWGLVLALGIILRRDLRASLADLRAAANSLHTANRFERWLALFVAISLLLTFLTALAPPTGWDSLVYHLTGPRLFIQAGRVTHPIDLPYLGFPQLGEMQFTLGMLLAGDGVAPLLHFGYGLLGVVIAASLARRAFGERVVWPTAALLLSVPSLLSLMARAYVDATLLFYMTAALYAFVRWREMQLEAERDNGLKWLRLMGVFCGFCAGVKYTAVAVPFALGLSLIWTSRRDTIRTILERLAWLAGVFLVVSLPWLVKNWLTTGNPIYPFFFDGIYWDNWRAWWYDRPGTGLATTAPWDLLTIPVEATILGFEGADPYDATIGPLLLMTAPLLIFVWRAFRRDERAVLGHLLLFFGVNYGLWLVGLARSALLVQTRLLLPTFGVVAILGAVALDRLTSLRWPELALDWLARAVVNIALGLILFSTLTTFLRINPLPVTFGLESRESYLARRLGIYYTVITEINELPADSRVVFLWEPRSYHCQVDCQPDALLDRFLHLTHLYGDADSIARTWKEENVTHVLLFEYGMKNIVEEKFDPITEQDLAIMKELQTDYLTPIREWGDYYTLYELAP